MFDDETDYLKQKVDDCLNEEKLLKQMKQCMVVCIMLEQMELPPDFKKKNEDMLQWIRDLLTNPEFVKSVKGSQALCEREPVVYFKDSPKGDYYDYDDVLEKDISEIEFALAVFLGETSKQLQSLEEI